MKHPKDLIKVNNLKVIPVVEQIFTKIYDQDIFGDGSLNMDAYKKLKALGYWIRVAQGKFELKAI